MPSSSFCPAAAAKVWTISGYVESTLLANIKFVALVSIRRPVARLSLMSRENLGGMTTAAIAALPPGAGRALRLHRIEGLKHEEVARILGISRSGVEKHLAVAMKHLRAALLGSGLLAHGAQSYPAPSRESANQA